MVKDSPSSSQTARSVRAFSHSLSMSHNSDGGELFAESLGRAVNVRANQCPALPVQGDFVAKMLSGSQQKTAFALRLNAERMIRENGLNQSGLLTLTVGDFVCDGHGLQIPDFKDHCPACKAAGKIRRMKFKGVFDAAEASRRINNLRKFILTLFKRANPAWTTF